MGKQPVAGSWLLPGRFARRACREKDAPFTSNPVECKGVAGPCFGLKDARRRLSAEAAVEDAQHRPRPGVLEGIGQGRHLQGGARKIRRVGVREQQASVRGTVAGESDDDHVILLRPLQRTQDGVRHFAVGRLLIDQAPCGQPLNGVGEQRPERHGVSARTAQLRNRGIQISVDSDKDRLHRHAASEPIRPRSCSTTLLTSRCLRNRASR